MFSIVNINTNLLSGLKQHRLIILQFWRSEVRNGSHWVIIQPSVGRDALPPEAREENLFPSLLQPPEPSCLPWLEAPATVSSLYFCLHSRISFSGSPASPVHLEAPFRRHRAHLDNPGFPYREIFH